MTVAGPEHLPAAELFRTYDIRGAAADLAEGDAAWWLGRAIATVAAESAPGPVALGRDGRLSSPAIAAAVADGLRAGGANVIDLGAIPTPLLYYGAWRLARGNGVMVTASHNPPADNGLKIVLGRRTLFGDGIRDLRHRLQEGALTRGDGSYRTADILADYRSRIAEDIRLERPLEVVVDAGNGIAGPAAVAVLEALGARVHPLHCEPDGHFPHHHPDPSRPENLADLAEAVRHQGADLGLAFDGDGDRLGVVDEQGRMVWPDRLLALFLPEVLAARPGAAVLFDVKSTGALFSAITEAGGRPVMTPSGHSLIRARMEAEGAVLAGELTGHLFLADRWFGFDDALYAAARILELVARAPTTADALGEPGDCVATPEIHLPVARAHGQTVIAALQAMTPPPGAAATTVDGLRLDFPRGWGLIRLSNTADALVLRFEAADVGELAAQREQLRRMLAEVDPALAGALAGATLLGGMS
ncbi:phosphomannomutase / phosphoglucomutase [Thiohalospira halophila DSM 15071]|uniref:phosphomannomutase n=1 Tax=Thiohalospira halophila DSM 15071 TaxID=1123397 RepID=A0A1I1SL15_9GAMM|nr:phosphomannomutase/phosphoglucomutase [Thiohalospira halophila]SFD47101.1 phosphomannomutase / phosphoglucomutase [Thiohalospira halophila DSM 15071]